MKTFLLILLFPLLASAAKKVAVDPVYQKRRFVALTPTEKSDTHVDPIGLLAGRASAVCEFLKQPAGNFKSRSASEIRTGIVDRKESELILLERRSGRWEPKILRLPVINGTEEFSSLNCQANR